MWAHQRAVSSSLSSVSLFFHVALHSSSLLLFHTRVWALTSGISVVMIILSYWFKPKVLLVNWFI